MRIVITVEEGPATGRRWLLRPGDRMVFGRTERSDIMLANDPLLSSCHFRISLTDDGCTVEDLQSTNGTHVNDKMVKTVHIAEGDRILAGSSVFVVKHDSPNAFVPLAQVEDVPVKKTPPLSDEELAGSNSRETWDAKEVVSDDLIQDDGHPLARATEPLETGEESPEAKPAPMATSKKRPATASTIPIDFRLEVRRCVSGAWSATQVSSAQIHAGLLLGLLGGSCPIRLIVDFARAGLDPPSGTGRKSKSINVATDAAQGVSPQMMRGEDVPLIDWVSTGWGTDAMVILFSYVEIEPILDHYKTQLSSFGSGDAPRRGVAAICRPSVLESLLSSGDRALVTEILDPCEAILLESKESPGGWILYGNVRMAAFLKSSGVPFTEQ